jgi:Pyridoxamine 5'-phosphate oxidase
MIWAEFEAAAPELARRGRERIELFDCVMVGTIRRDGGPRVNPVEAYIVDGHLLVNMMPRSHKALDLLRDPRIFVHTLVTSRSGDEGEFKLRGRAPTVEDTRLRTQLDDLFERRIHWRPPSDSHYFDVHPESAAFVRYVDGRQELARWRAATT